MKVYLNRSPRLGPWGGGNAFVGAFRKRVPNVAGVELLTTESVKFSPDVILLSALTGEGMCLGFDQAVMYREFTNPNCAVVLRVNENDARKGTKNVDRDWLKASQYVDGTIFVSDWLQQHYNARGWRCKRQAVIRNGVAPDIFAAAPKPQDGRLHVVAHHWSDNPMKGKDIYEAIDGLVGKHPDRLAFTYVGRHRCDFKHAQVISPTSGKKLGEELGRHDVYVSASRFEPGPNHVLEALSCGLPTWVHAEGGAAVEFAGADHSYVSWDELSAVLLDPDRAKAPNSSARPLQGWTPCVEAYIAFLEETWKAKTQGSPTSLSSGSTS